MVSVAAVLAVRTRVGVLAVAKGVASRTEL